MSSDSLIRRKPSVRLRLKFGSISFCRSASRLCRYELHMNVGSFGQGAKVVRVGGENVVAVGGQADDRGVDGAGLATAGQQHPGPAPEGVVDWQNLDSG